MRVFLLLFFLQFRDLGVEAGRPLGYLPRRGVEVGSLAGIFLVFFRYLFRISVKPRFCIFPLLFLHFEGSPGSIESRWIGEVQVWVWVEWLSWWGGARWGNKGRIRNFGPNQEL